MSVISFSGLVTGLDTDSWVSALTALKNAKVEELEEEKSALESLQDVVSNIKSYFSSFRSALEKLTDAKFGIDSLDLFVQNLANSSNPSLVTATATSSAARDTYEVGVTQVASSTKVNTAIRQTVSVTSTAAGTTKLTVLGVEEGYVSINNREFEITNSDTINSLIDKMSEIGVNAYYDEDTGIFTIATNIYEADDGSTKLFESLGLDFVDVEGLESSQLMTEGYVTIKPTTLLSDIGATGGAIIINQQQINLDLGADATVQTFLDYINNNYGADGASAVMDSDGYITITGIDIKEVDGGSNILTALGLVEKVDSVTSSSDGLSYTKEEVITETTKLGDINTTFSNYNLVLSDGTTSTTVSMSSTSTVGDVISQIESYAANNGMNAVITLDEDGIITISGDIDNLYLSGGVIDGLGLTMESVNGTEMTSSALKYTSTMTASSSTTFGELGITGSSLKYDVLDERAEVVASGLTVSQDTTLEEWFNSLKQYGITATISDEGVISIDGTGLISGNLATALGLSYVKSGSEVSITEQTSNELSGTKTVVANASSSLDSLGISGGNLVINAGGVTTTYTYTGTSTLGEIITAIEASGGTADITDGLLSISGVDKLSGTLVDELGLIETTVDGTSLTTGVLTYETSYLAEGTTTLGDLGLGNETLYVYNEYGELLDSTTLTSGTTLDEISSYLSSYGLSLDISDGVISISGGVISGTFAEKTGISQTTSGTIVMSTEQVSTILQGSTTTTATEESSLSSMGLNGSYTLGINGKSYTLNGNTTLGDIKNYIESNGGTFSLQDGDLTISGENISGTILDALGLSPTIVNGTEIYSTGVSVVSGSIATESSKFSDYGISTTGKTFNIYSTTGELIASNLTLSSNATIGDFLSTLQSYGLNASITESGEISISNGTIDGSLADALGITTNAYMTVVNSKTLVSKSITAKVSTTAGLDTTLSDLGISGTQYLTINHNGTVSGFNFSGNSTIADIRDAVISAGGEFEIIDGYISISGVELSGSLATNLGIEQKAGSASTVTTTQVEFTVRTITITTTATATAVTTSTAIVTVTSVATTTAVSVQTLTVTTTSTAIATQTLTVTTTSTAIATVTSVSTSTAVVTVTSVATSTAISTVTSVATSTAVVTVTSVATSTAISTVTSVATSTAVVTVTSVATSTAIATVTSVATSTAVVTVTSIATSTNVTTSTVISSTSYVTTITQETTTEVVTRTTLTYTQTASITGDTAFGDIAPGKSSFTLVISRSIGNMQHDVYTLTLSSSDTLNTMVEKVNELTSGSIAMSYTITEGGITISLEDQDGDGLNQNYVFVVDDDYKALFGPSLTSTITNSTTSIVTSTIISTSLYSTTTMTLTLRSMSIDEISMNTKLSDVAVYNSDGYGAMAFAVGESITIVMSNGTSYKFTVTSSSTVSDFRDWLRNCGLDVSLYDNSSLVGSMVSTESGYSLVIGGLSNVSSISGSAAIVDLMTTRTTTRTTTTRVMTETSIVTSGTKTDYTYTTTTTINETATVTTTSYITQTISSGTTNIIAQTVVTTRTTTATQTAVTTRTTTATQTVVTTRTTTATQTAVTTRTTTATRTVVTTRTTTATQTAVTTRTTTATQTVVTTRTTTATNTVTTTNTVTSTRTTVTTSTNIQSKTVTTITTSTNIQSKTVTTTATQTVVKTDTEITTMTSIRTTTEETTSTYVDALTKTVTTTSTENIVYRSGQQTYIIDSTTFNSTDTLLSAIGITNGTVNKVVNGTTSAFFTVTSSSTLSDFIAALIQNGFAADFSNGRLTITSNDDSYITNGTSNLVTELEFTTTTSSATYYQNSTSDVLDNRVTTRLTATSSLGSFTSSVADRTINVTIDDQVYSHTFSSTDTIQDVMDYLESLGIDASLNNGTFTASSSLFEFSLSGNLGNIILGSDPAFTTTTTTAAWTATLPESTNSVSISGSTKLVDLGVTEGSIKIYDNGTYITRAFNITSDTTIDDLFSALNGFGFTTELKDGKIYISADSDMYIINESSNLVSKLGLTTSKVINTIYTSTTSNTLSYSKTYTIDNNTTMADLGFSNNVELRISVDGTLYSLSFGANESIQNVIDTLAVYGITASINNGTFSASSTEHTFTLGGELGNILTSNNPQYSTITTVTGYYADLPDSVNDVEINLDTKLVDLGVTEGSIKVYDNGTWINTAISIDENTTIQDFINALQGYGFTAKLEDGKLTITSDSDKYITDETSNLVSKLGLTNRTSSYADLYDQTNSKTLTVVTTHTTDETTTLKDLGFSSGASLRIEINGTIQTIGFSANETVSDIIDALKSLGIEASISNGTFSATSTDTTFNLTGTLADALNGSAPTYIQTEKVVSYISSQNTTDVNYIADTSTKITDLGVSTGYINVLTDGEITASIAIEDNTTIGQLFSALAAYGVAASINADGVITIESIGDVTLSDGTSNLVSLWGLDDNITKATYTGTTLVLEDNVNLVTEDTLVSYFDTADSKAEGSIYLSLYDQNGNLSNYVINIDETDTIGDVLQKFQNIGLTAYLEDGVITIHNGLGSINVTGGSSNLIDNLNLSNNIVETWMQSTDPIEIVQDEISYLSIVNYADTSTTLETLGVTSGDLSIGVNGAVKTVNVESSDTIANLISRISQATNGSVTASLTSDGRFTLTAAEGVELFVGTSTDTTNLATVFNLDSNGSNVITGGTSLYKASASSKITESGLFRLGDVTEGTFIIGNATFTITSDTTIASLVSEINRNEDANASAYWDSINGKLVITSNVLGASYVNIQSGTSNIAEIFGLITTDSDGTERLATYNQTLGNNAIVTINGTRIVSTSNTITSDVSRIEGLTINIKGLTEGEYVTITVERDTQSIIDAVQDALDAYNTLIAELNTALSISGDLHGDTALSGLRNQLVSILTSKGTNGTSIFRNLAAIGISTASASTALTSDIYSLYLDTDKFTSALDESENDVKLLLVGTTDNPGILTRVENLVEDMLSASGYFSSKASAISRDITSYENKIAKAQAAVEFYQNTLTRKFKNMELLYSSMSSAYSNLFSLF